MRKTEPSPAKREGSSPALRLTARALLEAKRLSDPQIHPDGRRIAFVVREADFDESRWISHVWITEWAPPDAEHELCPDADGLATAGDRDAPTESEQDGEDALTPEDLTRQLTFSREGESDPQWSPDGRYLAFLSIRLDLTESSEEDEDEEEPLHQVWALPLDGGEARRITNAKEGILDFAWAPDGDTLFYLTAEPRVRPLESIHQDRERHKFDPIVEHEDPRRRQFWSIDVEERKPKLQFSADHGVESFAVSPDGSRIAYVTNYTGDDNDYHIADLYVRYLDSGKTVKLVRRAGGKYRLRWSPDGRQIAFLSWLDPALSYSRETIYIADVPVESAAFPSSSEENEAAWSKPPDPAFAADRSAAIARAARAAIEAPGIRECRAISELDYDITSFEWAEEPGVLNALVAVGTGSPLYRFEPGKSILLTAEHAERRDLALHRESGAAVYVQESAARFPEILLREADGQEHWLTRLNADLQETYRLPRQEAVQWQSADGQIIEGLLTYPLDHQAGNRSPLLVQVHGGPKSRATETLLDYYMPAVWASEGYMVLRPNYRGSEGYGHAFAVANRRDLGGEDFRDILSGVDWCLAQGLADPDRLGILGGSYGGYMTNWAIGHTDRFKAAISMFGIFNLQTDFSNSRLSRWEHDYLGSFYWEDSEIYRRLSPGSYLANIRTPTLILHGDEDDNTFISNSKELYQALRQRGVVTQFVHYPREGHGLQEPNHRSDEIRRSLAWMDRYVRGTDGASAAYRIGDAVPETTGILELCVERVQIGTFIGQAQEKEGVARETLLEVVLTLHRYHRDLHAQPVQVSLQDIRLAAADVELTPIGVPIEVPGGKVLLEGEGLHVTQHPDQVTGELAFGLAVVFRAPTRDGEGSLHLPNFPPVAIAWSSEHSDASEEDSGASTPE